MPSFKDFRNWSEHNARKAQQSMGGIPTPNWMLGRYGADNLNNFLIVVALVCFLSSMVPVLYPLSWVGTVLIIIAIARMFSRKVDKRYQENVRFLRATAGIRKAVGKLARNGRPRDEAHRIDGAKRTWRSRHARPSREERKVYRYFSCPFCKQRVRVPRGKGIIRIICPSCRKEFYKKS